MVPGQLFSYLVQRIPPGHASSRYFTHGLRVFIATGYSLRVPGADPLRGSRSFTLDGTDTLATLGFYCKRAIADLFSGWTDLGEYAALPIDVATDLPPGATGLSQPHTSKLVVLYKVFWVGICDDRPPGWRDSLSALREQVDSTFGHLLTAALREGVSQMRSSDARATEPFRSIGGG